MGVTGLTSNSGRMMVKDLLLLLVFLFYTLWCNSWCLQAALFQADITVLGFPDGSDSQESACNMGDLGSIPGWGRSPGGRHGNPFQHSCLENPHGQSSLAGYSPWGLKESDMTKRLSSAHIMDGIHLVICTMNDSCEFPYFCQQCNGLPFLLTPNPHSHLRLPPPSSINVQYKHGNAR